MGLPKIDQPLFELKIPSTNKKVKYRPFTVKEEKALLIAQEAKDPNQMVLAMKQVLGNCLQDYDVDELAIFDIEYVMLHVRSKAVSNKLEFTVKDPDTEEDVEIEIDIDDIEVVRNQDHKDVVQITDDVYLKMRYPRIDYIREVGAAEDQKSSEMLFNLMLNCIDSVVQGESVYQLKDFSDKEVEDFIDSLGAGAIAEIKKFFDTIPKVKYEHKYVNKNGDEKTFVVEGTETFFI